MHQIKSCVSGIILTLILSVSLCAQTGTCLVHIDKPFYVNGEILWYKLYLPIQFAERERVIHVAVVDDQGTIVNQHYLRTDGATQVHGYYKVPFDCRTGVYELIFNGIRAGLGKNVLLATVFVSIYNDFELIAKDQLTSASTASTESNSSNTLNDLTIEITAQEGLGVGSEHNVIISVRDRAGQPVNADLSIAIVDNQIVPRSRIVQGPSMRYGVVEDSLLNEVNLKGTVYNRQGDVMQINVLGAFTPDSYRVEYSKSDKNGAFGLTMTDFTGDKKIQFISYQDEVDWLKVELSKEVVTRHASKQIDYSSDVLKYLKLSRQRKRIFQYFTTLEQNIQPTTVNVNEQEIVPDASYIIAEYEEFDFIKDFFGELITPLKIDMVDSTFFASMQNPHSRNLRNTHLSGDPLFIVDGRMTRNADYVARLEMSPIERVDLIYDTRKLKRYFNAIGKSGVVRITTKLRDGPFPEDDLDNIFTVSGILPQASFPALSSDDFDSALYPLIRPQLYWNPEVSTDSEGVARVRFHQSDDLSTFRITVVAQSTDGSRGYGETTYNVILR